jgi:hypothetical protein
VRGSVPLRAVRTIATITGQPARCMVHSRAWKARSQSSIAISDRLGCCHIAASSWRARGDALQVAGITATTVCPTTLENSLAARSGELQLERGADRTDWLAFEAWNGAGELLAQGAESRVIS